MMYSSSKDKARRIYVSTKVHCGCLPYYSTATEILTFAKKRRYCISPVPYPLARGSFKPQGTRNVNRSNLIYSHINTDTIQDNKELNTTPLLLYAHTVLTER